MSASEKPQPEPTLTERIAEALHPNADYWEEPQEFARWLDSLPARVEEFARRAAIKQAEVCTPREHWPPLITRTVTDASLLAALPALSTPQTEAE